MSLGSYIPGSSVRSSARSGADRIASMSLWQQLRSAGAPPEEVERARLQEALYGPAGAVEVANLLGIQPREQEREGIISRAFDYLQRPGSFVVGMWTGLLGIDKIGKGGEVVEDGRGLEEALDRGLKGLAGIEQYRTNEFGALVRNEDDSGAEKVAKTVAGFLLDTALDPLTYVSGPGSIFGRKAGSEVIDRGIQIGFRKLTRNGDRVIDRFDEAQKIDIMRKILDTKQTSPELMLGSVISTAVNKITDPRRRRRAKVRIAEDLMNYLPRFADDLGTKFKLPAMPAELTLDDVIKVAKDNNLFDDLFIDTVAGEVARSYVGRQFTGAHRSLLDMLGDSGEELWRLLPVDMQGGLRVRVPFIRKVWNDDDSALAIKTALSFRVPGTGPGGITSKLAILNNLKNFTHTARNFIRDVPGISWVLTNMNGREGGIFRKMAVDTFGEQADNGAILYRAYSHKVKANLESAKMSAEMKSDIGIAANAVVRLVRNGQDEFGDAFLSADGRTGAFQDQLENIDLIDDKYIDGLTDPLQKAAASAVSIVKREMDNVAALIEDVLPDFTRLEADYFPRIWELFMSQFGRTFKSGPGGKSGGGLKNLGNQRVAWAAVLDTSGKVVRWRTPKEIADITGIDIFKVDPVEAILNYMMAVRVVLNREFTMKELINRGLVVYPQIMREVPDMESAVEFAAGLRNRLLRQQTALESFEQEIASEGPEALGLSAVDAAEERVALSLRNFLGADDYAGTIAGSRRPLGAELRFEAMRDLVAPSIKVGGRDKPLTEMTVIKLLATVTQYGRRMFDRGFRSMGNRLVFFDGYYIQKVARGYRIISPTGQMLSKVDDLPDWKKARLAGDQPQVADDIVDDDYIYDLDEGAEDTMPFREEDIPVYGPDNLDIAEDLRELYGWSVSDINPRKGIYFETEQEAIRLLAQIRREARDGEYIRFSESIRERAEREIIESIRRIEEYGNLTQRGARNAFDVSSIPAHLQEEYFAGLVDVINRWADKVKFTRWEVSGEDYQEKIGEFMKPIGSGSTFDALPGIVNRAKQARIFAPEGLVESIERMFGGYRNPDAWGKFIEDFYLPFYALQKSLMTAQRGTGYIFRNIIGGMWNAYLVGVNATHFKMASQIKIAEFAAQAEARKRAASEVGDYAEIERRALTYFEEIFANKLRSKFGIEKGEMLFRAVAAWESNLLRGASPTSLQTGVNAIERAVDTPEIYGNIIVDPSRGIAQVRDMGRVRRVIHWGARENLYARFMVFGANQSEDFLRLATFLRGADLFGIEDAGFAASMFVKSSQFDYSDLSEFEANTVKLIMPFYTWTRNNVPLQFRALLSEPGKVNRALRINESLAGLWGEDDPESPLPSYVRDRFGWQVRKEVWQTAKGDPIAAGLAWGEPFSDLNRLFRAPSNEDGFGPIDAINWRELVNAANPLLKTITETVSNIDSATGGLRPDEEEAPPWALPFSRKTPDGKRVVSSALINGIRDQIPTIGQIERLLPNQLGNERYQRRLLTNRMSVLTGLPVSTLDAFQVAGELRARQRRLQGQMERAVGESLTERASFARELLRAGVTDTELDVLESEVFKGDLVTVPLQNLNPSATAATVRFIRNIQLLEASGVPRATLAQMWANFTPPTERERSVQRGLTAEELAQIGLTPSDVAGLSAEEREKILRNYFG